MAKKLSNKDKRKIRQIKQGVQETRIKDYREQVLFQYMAMLIVLRDEHGFGKKRLTNVLDEVLNQKDCYTHGYVSVNDLAQTLYDETGLNVPEYILNKYNMQ